MANNFTNFKGHMEPMELAGLQDGIEDEDDIIDNGCNISDTKFDVTVGHIEDIVMSDQFQTIQNNFLEKYYVEFEDTDENKFVYTDIHQEYARLVEKLLDDELTKLMPDFSMEEFQQELIQRKDELDSEIFEILLTFSDFLVFKEMMLAYRSQKEGTAIDLTNGIKVTAYSPLTTDARVHQNSPPRGGSGGDNHGNDIRGATIEPSQRPAASSASSNRNNEEEVAQLGSDLDFLVVGKAIRPKPEK